MIVPPYLPSLPAPGIRLNADFPARAFPVLPQCGFSRTLKGMEVHFTPEQEAELSQIAAYAGTDAERLVKDAALRFLQEEVRFRAAVAGALAHLESRREEVNDLNVFPVADGDTGDNMVLTMRAVLDELDRVETEGVGRARSE